MQKIINYCVGITIFAMLELMVIIVLILGIIVL